MNSAGTKLKSTILKILEWLGYRIIRIEPSRDFPSTHVDVAKAVKNFTMTNIERLSAVQTSTEYIVKNKIPGAIVECGVWRGGTIMAIIHTLIRLRDVSRDIYLFDTFEGMTPPKEMDRDFNGRSAEDLLSESERIVGNNVWAIAPFDDVRANVLSLGYPVEKIHFIKEDVLKTLPSQAPSSELALLRLDTDWYESTKHELNILYPRLIDGGILIIDDYGHFEGAKKAVDEYFETKKFFPLLNRIDYTGRLIVRNLSAERNTYE